MRRRALLAAVAAGSSTLAGCSVLESEDPERGTFDVSETTASTTTLGFDADPSSLSRGFAVPGTDDHEVAVTTPEDVPDGLEVTLGFANPPSREAPATVYLRVAVRETADRSVDVPVGATPPFSTYEGATADGGRRLYVVPRRAGVEFDELVRRDRGCWRPRLPVGPDEPTAGSRTLEPGDALEREYYLVTPWANDRCLQPDQYRFEADAGWSFHVAPFFVQRPEESAYADASVPGLPGFETTHWYHDAGHRLYVAPDAEQVGLPSATTTLDLHNHLRRAVTVDERAWTLYKLDAGSWYPIAPLTGGPARRRLLPGETSTLALQFYTDPDAPDAGTRYAVGGLGQGRYAVGYPLSMTIPGRDPGPSTDAGPSSESVESGPRAALLTVVGNEPPLDTADAIDHVDVRDGTAHAHTTADESAPASVRVARNGSSDAPRPVREQVLQCAAIRSAVALLRDGVDGERVDSVLYHAEPATIDRARTWLASVVGATTFGFEGATYRVSVD
ncbi:hypothetical protein G9C85_02435 [Halorubellus sp. JP-L1]|uniref:hypothetical protein n=1 Tax=Halorubellus sp. JP-L1 TaxID=2715753 RepID=UPI001407E9F3|nr:hypothetical protein [Halorubellus sp. JP-L1]NHN40495.1 hypothetical protein [Halorubellus sp. JP-L1]